MSPAALPKVGGFLVGWMQLTADKALIEMIKQVWYWLTESRECLSTVPCRKSPKQELDEMYVLLPKPETPNKWN